MEFVILYLLVNIAVGAIACFMGKKLFYVMLGALVFLGVFNIGMCTSDGSPVSLIVALVLGVVAALLSKCAYKAGVFLIGCAAGAALGFIVSLFLPQEYAGYSMVVLALAAILLGLAALKWCDFFVRVGTAYTGATFVVPNVLAAVLAFGELTALAVPADSLATFNALSDYIANDFASLYGTPIFLGTLILTIAGSIVQQRQ